ncbi:hypothetical protein AM418_002883 [Klebsiella pneumoniae]|nr:hypothetical protein L425_02631 [Klebsiella quasipneumoniae subsp. quasipneumoniae]OKN40144.1 hypothetical protein AM418_002883 [Klebsiella pneumoniae]
MEYNNQRTHESLNNLTPEEYRLMAEKTGNLKKCVELKRMCLHNCAGFVRVEVVTLPLGIISSDFDASTSSLSTVSALHSSVW